MNELFFSREKLMDVYLEGENYFIEVSFKDEYHSIITKTLVDKKMKIIKTEVVLERVPYKNCEIINSLIKKLEGVVIESGFTKILREKLGGREGCTHLLDIYQDMARAAVQANLKDIMILGGEEKLNEKLKETCNAY